MPASHSETHRDASGRAGPLGAVGRALVELFYPSRCAGCGAGGALFCDSCRARTAYILPPVCLRCARPVPQPGLCATCRRTPSSLDAIFSVAAYTPPLRPAIHAFKYKGLRALAQPLGGLMAGLWPPFGHKPDLLLAVPLHPSRERQRGYNQSALLADQVATLVGIERSDGLVQRGRETRPQVGLGWSERRENMQGAFECTGNVRGKRIVLVDDVCTTGATLEACAAVLRSDGGAAEVVGFTLARAGIGDS